MSMLYKVGATWYYGVKVDGKWVRRSSRSRDEEEAKKQQIILQDRINRGEPLDGRKIVEGTADQTFAAFAEDYVRHKQKDGKDTERDENALAHLKAAFGTRRLADLRRRDVDTYMTKRREAKAKPDTIQREVVVLRALFNQAIRWERIDKNPAALTTVKGANKPRKRLLAEDEITALLDACRPLLRDLVETALYTAMRKGELLALEERDCDFLKETIAIRESKTGESRNIPMHPRVRAILWDRMKGTSHRQVFPIVNVQRPFQQAVRQARLSNVRFHDLRHCAASYLFMKGTDPRTVMEIGGWSDPRIPLRIYASVSDQHKRKAIGELSFGKSDMTRTYTVSREPNASIVSSEKR